MSGGGDKDKKSISPYTLASTDNPGTLITHSQLKGANYEALAKAMRIALGAKKKKKGFIDGTMAKLADQSDELEDWWTVNSMVVSWVFNTIEANLRSTISYREMDKELWDDIQQLFSVGHGPRIHQLKTEVMDCKQNGETVMSYYGRMKKLWDDLNDYDQMPMCTCNGCKCILNERLERKEEDERVHQFLMGLDDAHFDTIRSAIIATEPLPNVNKVYS